MSAVNRRVRGHCPLAVVTLMPKKSMTAMSGSSNNFSSLKFPSLWVGRVKKLKLTNQSARLHSVHNRFTIRDYAIRDRRQPSSRRKSRAVKLTKLTGLKIVR